MKTVHKHRVSVITFLLFSTIFLISYGLIPMVFLKEVYERYVSILLLITIISCICVGLGMFFPSIRSTNYKRKVMPFSKISKLLFWVFILSTLVTFLTAEKIPLVASFQGADERELAYLREMFLKARTGWQSSLVYINALITGVLLPYLIAFAFEKKISSRFLLAIIYFVYCISFLEKAYFLKIALPLLYLFFIKSKSKLTFIFFSFSLVFFTFIALGTLSKKEEETAGTDSFFSTSYTWGSPTEQIIWRSVAIPIVTAVDGVKVFYEVFNAKYLYGTTSSFIAFIQGEKQINFEREVFGAQWGQNQTDTGNSNSTFLIEAFVNWGYLGVTFFSFIIGRILRLFIRSKNVSLQAISPIFIFQIYNAGLIGTLLSNGYLLLVLFELFFSLEDDRDK